MKENLLTVIEPQKSVAITPATMIQTAIEKGASVEQLERLLQLQERWEATEARKAFVVALAAFKANPPTVGKNKHVKFGQTEFDHATLDHVCAAVVPALSKHGLSHRWETEQAENGQIRVTAVLTHILGHSERVSLQSNPDASGSKNSIQAIGSATTYLMRYTLLAACGLATTLEDDDGSLTNGDFITPEQVNELQHLAETGNADKIKFCQFMKVQSIAAIPAKRFQEAKSALQKKAGAK